ncbi:ATP-binding protein [Curtobacterium luteum]|uniref:ATP-binding protein n=1 Tax=Curtobacterium luteum TaxID=33881 RepID=UPI000B222F09|nr:ATP-binding protein [Curtobacterium luteum]
MPDGDGGAARVAPAAPARIVPHRLDVLESRVRTAVPAGARVVVLLDGRSGTGKTTLGDALAERIGAQVVHLDDVYPGWDGLRAAAAAVSTDVLGPASGYRRWDWATSAPAGWTTVDPDLPVVVEGCGALSRASAPLASLRVWLEADDDERWRRAIGRDGDVFAREWDRWAAQEQAFIDAEDPASLADVVIRT